MPKIHLILYKTLSLDKESKLVAGRHSSPKREELDKCWDFIYNIYLKHRDAFEIHSNEQPSSRPSVSSSDQHSTSSVNNHFNDLIQPETYEEFMCQYVMHIVDDMNTVSRIAVKAHSPLLAFKNPHHLYEYQAAAQTFDQTLNDIVERI